MIRKFLTTVTVKNNYVTITNFDVNEFFRLIAIGRKTKKLISFDVFTSSSWREISFSEFFIPEVYYLLSQTYEAIVIDGIPVTYGRVAITSAKIFKLYNLLQKLKANTWLKNIDINYPDILDLTKLNELTYTPKDYQLDFFKYYNKTLPKFGLKGTLLDAAAGSGKSYTGLALAHCLNAARIIIICPLPAVTRVWDDQINKIFKKSQSYYLSTDSVKYQQQRIAVYHYEALNRAMEDIEKLKVSDGRVVVILDESHNLNNPKSLRTQLFEKFVVEVKASDTIFASGTAVKALANELVTLFRIIDPLFTAEAEFRFKKVYSQSKVHNLELLKTRLGQVSFKVEKSAINLLAPNLINLPVTIPDGHKYTLDNVVKDMRLYIEDRTDHYAKLLPDNFKFYNYCIDYYEELIRNDRVALTELQQYKNAINEIRVTNFINSELSSFANKIENKSIIPKLKLEDRVRFKEVKTLIKYPKLKVQGEALGRILGKLRMECHRDMAEQIDYNTIIQDAEKKVVIFSSYINVCQSIVDKLRQYQYNSIGVYGVFTKNLTQAVDRFMTDDTINPLVATYASLSTAVPLIIANTMVLINAPFRTYIRDQAISRIHRLGADTPIFIYECYLDTGDEPNLSTRGIDILKWSQEQVSLILGTKSIFEPVDIVDDVEGLNISNESYGVEHIEIYAKLRPSVKKNNILENW